MSITWSLTLSSKKADSLLEKSKLFPPGRQFFSGVMRAFRLLVLAGRDHYFWNFIRRQKPNVPVVDKKKENPEDRTKYIPFLSLYDSFSYSRARELENYANNLFAFIEQGFADLNPNEALTLLERVITFSIIATKGNQTNEGTCRMSTHLLKYNPTATSFKASFQVDLEEVHPAFDATQIIYEAIYWIHKLGKNWKTYKVDHGDNKHFEYRIYFIILNVINNLDAQKITSDLFEEIKTIMNEVICNAKWAKLYTQSVGINLTVKTRSDLIDLKGQTQGADGAPRVFGDYNYISWRTVTIKPCSDEKYDEIVADADRLWNNDQKKLAHCFLVKRWIKKKFNSKKMLKAIEKLKVSIPASIHLLELFEANQMKPNYADHLNTIIARNMSILELYTLVDNYVDYILSVYYGSPITEQIDFHYLYHQLTIAAGLRSKFDCMIMEIITDFTKFENLQKFFVETKREIDQMKESFDIWQQVKIKPFDEKKLKSKHRRKMIKWISTEKASKLKKIAARKAWLKKQRAIADRVMRIRLQEGKKF